MAAFLLVLVCAAITVASFSCGLTGLGHGIIFQTCWSLMHSWGVEGAGDLRVGVAVSFLMGPVTSAYLGPAALRGGEVRWELVVALAPGTIIAQYIGTAALVVLNQDVLKKMLGLLFFAFALWRLSVMGRDRIRARWEEQNDFLAAVKERERKNQETEAATGAEAGATADLEKGQARSGTESNRNEASVTHVPSSSAARAHRYEPVDMGAQAGEAEERGETAIDPSASLIHSTQLAASDAPMAVESVSTAPSLLAPSSPSAAAFSPPPSPPDAQVHPLRVESFASHDAAGAAAVDLPAPSPSPTGVDSEIGRLAVESSSGGGVTIVPPALSSRPPSFAPRAFFAWLRPWLSTRVFQWALLAGFASGFLNGLFGTGGPPIMALFAMIEISKGAVRGTSVWSGLLRILPAGVSLLAFGIFRAEDWPIYLLLPVFCVAGTAAGSRAHKHVDVQVVMAVMQGLVLLSTVSLTDAMGGGPFAHLMLALYALVAAAAVTFAAFLASMHWRFVRVRPQLADQWAERQAEKREAKRAEADGLPLRPLLQLPDGSADSYTSWHE